MAKITRATVKKFIKENIENLQVNHKSSFSGMTDGIESLNGGWHKANRTENQPDHTLGVDGLWLVGGRDYFEPYNENGYQGIEISNCCGNSIIAIKK